MKSNTIITLSAEGPQQKVKSKNEINAKGASGFLRIMETIIDDENLPIAFVSFLLMESLS